MAVGKDKQKYTKKNVLKKRVDPMSRKDWYDVKAPAIFTKRICGMTCVNRTVGQKLSSVSLKGRTFELSLADLMGEDSDRSFIKFSLIAEEVQGKEVLCNFNGLRMTTDKYCSLVRRYQTKIEVYVDVKTIDGYQLRVFVMAFTMRDEFQLKRRCYANQMQQKRIRRRIRARVTRSLSDGNIVDALSKFIPDTISPDIVRDNFKIHPLRDVHIRKVKVVKKPAFNLARFLEIHEAGGKPTVTSASGEDLGESVDRPIRLDRNEPPVLESV